MKAAFFILLAATSFSVLADDFACHLQTGYQTYSDVAPYRGRSASIGAGPFICVGSIVGDQIVTTVTFTENGRSETKSGRGFSVASVRAPYQRGDGLDSAVCRCGME